MCTNSSNVFNEVKIILFRLRHVYHVPERLQQGGAHLPRVRVLDGRLRHGRLGTKDGQLYPGEEQIFEEIHPE